MNSYQRTRLAGILSLVSSVAFIAHASSGEVTKRISGCDYFLVSTTKGYALLEWFGGVDPDVGDMVQGNFETYGMHALIVNDDGDTTVKVWVEDYWLKKTDALEKLIDKCD